MTLTTLIILLVVYQLKHFIADYPLQGEYMLGKFKSGWDWVKPLAAHCAVHAAFTLIIALIVLSGNIGLALCLALMDFVIHFCMDRVKASPNIWGKYNPQQPKFWYALGVDQMVHHLTHYIIIFIMLFALGGITN